MNTLQAQCFTDIYGVRTRFSAAGAMVCAARWLGSPFGGHAMHYQSSVCAVSALVIIALLGLGQSLFAATAPTTYSAYTGTDAKPIPLAPALGPANSVINDPTFGSRILRVTDQSTKSGQSFISIDSGFVRAWNADSTAIKLTGPHGDGYWLEFDPSSFRVGDGSSN